MYEAHSKGIEPSATIELQVVEPDELTQVLVLGVGRTLSTLDGHIEQRAKGWTLTRMPVLDLNVMRLGVFELLERREVPTAVILNEAVELAKRFSTDDSGRFVNGVLAAVATDVRNVD